jgi:hypothetical protein
MGVSVMNSTQPDPPGRGRWRWWRNWSLAPQHDDGDQKSAFERFDRWLTRSGPPWKPGLVVAVLAMAGGVLIVVVVPEMLATWLDPPADYPPAARTDWIDSVRTGLLGAIAFGSVAAGITQYRQAVLARTVDEYNEGVRQLSQDTWEQVAAIRDLEGIANTNPELRLKTLQMLAVYIRNRSPRTVALQDVPTVKPDKKGSEGKRRPEPGVQEALRVIGCHLGEWAPQPRKTKEDMADANEDVAGGEMGPGERSPRDRDAPSQESYVSLADIAIGGAVLRDAKLRDLNLRRSLMQDVKLERADLSGARLRDAVLSDADLEGAILVGTSLVGAKLHRADLRGANLSGAHLSRAVGLSNQLRQTIGTPHCLPSDSKCSRSGQERER